MEITSQHSVMNFLNEVSSVFPSAISFAAGRPTERFFSRLSPEALLNMLKCYEGHASGGRDYETRSRLLQYGRTAGIITDLVARQLQMDEGIPANADRVLITSGCQEAMALCLPALCPDPGDVVLVCNPTYIGVTGAANVSRVAVSALPNTVHDVAESIEAAVSQLQRTSRKARALYLIPDFDNPTGRVLDEVQRRDILAVCARHCIVILEDNAYGLFRYDGRGVPPMAALDKVGSVIYLSTFSKTLSPALRVGAASLPDTLFGDPAASRALWEDLVKRKSFLTVNTSQIAQAMVAGVLLDQNGSLRDWSQPALAWYRTNRDLMLSQLEAVFSPLSDDVRWNRPSGGFFLAVDLPFKFDANAVNECASQDNVIVMPMSFFALDDSQDQRIRLAFSVVEPQQIRTGVTALGRYVARRLGRLPKLTCEAGPRS
jgi:(S)-3,5-dihydroxyphenylglycine transaminase